MDRNLPEKKLANLENELKEALGGIENAYGSSINEDEKKALSMIVNVLDAEKGELPGRLIIVRTQLRAENLDTKVPQMMKLLRDIEDLYHNLAKQASSPATLGRQVLGSLKKTQ